MKYRFEVVVELKEGLLDPQGKTIEDSLPRMGWTNVSEVKVGKHITLAIDADGEADARAQVEEMARRLLSNPVIEEVAVRSMEEAS